MGRRWKYKTAEEARAAQKAQQAAFRKARKDGTWVPKYKTRSSSRTSPLIPSSSSPIPSSPLIPSSSSPIPSTSPLIPHPSTSSLSTTSPLIPHPSSLIPLSEREARKEDLRRAREELAKRKRKEVRRARALAKAKVTLESRVLKDIRRREQKALAKATIREIYGFTPGKPLATEAERAGFVRWQADEARLKAGEKAVAAERRAAAAKVRAEAKAAARMKERARDKVRLEKLVAKYRAERETIERVLREQAERAAAQEAAAASAARAKRIAEEEHRLQLLATRDERRAARQKLHADLALQYGFRVWLSEPDDPTSPQEAEARRQYLRAKEAAERTRKHDEITAYNREYRRRKRAEAFAAKQKLWTAAEWEAWQKQQQEKTEGPGTPVGVLKEVIRILTEETRDEGWGMRDEKDSSGVVGGDLRAPRDVIAERLLATGGIDFLLKGAEAMGAQKMKSPAMLKAAARALLFYLDPDRAGLFDIKPPERHVDPKRLLKGT